jgi:hypothetical protein
MQMTRAYWSNWAAWLRRLRLDYFAAWLLEAGAPVTLLGAQALFTVHPFLGPQSESLARMLEEQGEVRAFVAYLRGESAA